MLAKIFKAGLTYQGAVTVIAYLLNDRVKTGHAKVIKGDSELTLKFIFQASKKFKWSWFSGVLSFSEMLSREIINDIIKDFECTFFCGMHPDQYNILWVLHTDKGKGTLKGRTELHFIGPRLELKCRKYFNPYYVKRDFGKKDIYQEYTNQKWELSSYLDNQRLVYTNRPKWSGDKQTHQEELDDEILTMVKRGKLDSRGEIIDLLRNWDYEIVEIGTNCISIISDEGEKMILKGPIYSNKFSAGIDLLKERMKRECPPKIGIQDGVIVRESTRTDIKLERALDEIIEKQSYGNRQRYPSLTRKPRQVQKRRSAIIIKQKENSNDSNRERITRFINEERARVRTRKRRIAEIAEWNLWTESANHKYITESLESWIRARRLREYFEQSIRAILDKFGGIKQKLTERNQEALEIIKKRQAKKSLSNSYKIRM